jgi:peptidoglycan hydrolase CwlO-like protein
MSDRITRESRLEGLLYGLRKEFTGALDAADKEIGELEAKVNELEQDLASANSRIEVLQDELA